MGDTLPGPRDDEVNEIARALIAVWERVDDPVPASRAANFADMAREVLGRLDVQTVKIEDFRARFELLSHKARVYARKTAGVEQARAQGAIDLLDKVRDIVERTFVLAPVDETPEEKALRRTINDALMDGLIEAEDKAILGFDPNEGPDSQRAEREQAQRRLIFRAVNDPGSIVPRGPDYDGNEYGERLDQWQDRALAVVLGHQEVEVK